MRRQAIVTAGAWTLLMCGFLMGAGSVETLDGKAYRGEVSVDEGAVVVRAEGGAEVRVPGEQLRHVVFSSAPTSAPLAVSDGGVAKPWTSQDIGGVHLPGQVDCDASGAVTIKASGWGAWGDADSLRYVCRPLNGDGQITARIVAVDPSQKPVSVGVMIRQSLALDSLMAAACLHPAGELRLSRRSPNAPPDLGDGVKAAPGTWIRLARRGSVFAAYRSADGKTWEQVDSVRISMPAQTLAGLAAWTEGNTSLGQVLLDSVTVVEGSAGTSSFGSGIEQGLVLRDGTVWAGSVRSANQNTLTLTRGGQEKAIELSKVAAIILSAPPVELDTLVGKTGALLAAGDFVEGAVSGISIAPPADGKPAQVKVTVSSVVGGILEPGATQPVAAVLMAGVDEPVAPFRVRTADGSVQQAQAITLAKSGIVVDEKPVPDVVEIEKRVAKP